MSNLHKMTNEEFAEFVRNHAFRRGAETRDEILRRLTAVDELAKAAKAFVEEYDSRKGSNTNHMVDAYYAIFAKRLEEYNKELSNA